jgi:ATP-dependent helicase/nuclease subunit B
LENYQELAATVFADYGIPVFIDSKRSVMHHPLIELIRSALETVQRDWAYEPVFRYLKSDLAKVSRAKVDILENYILAHGIRGKSWAGEADWTYRRRYTLGEDTDISEQEAGKLALINKARRRAAGDLLKFTEVVKGAKTAGEFTTALCQLLEDMKVARKLERWSRTAEKAGKLEKAREHIQLWGKVMELFDEVVEALGDEQLSLESYQGVLDAGLESLRLGLIPPGLDQVIMGSLDRSRNPSHVRAVFLLGASDGVLPARPSSDGIFSDQERELLEAAGVKLAAGGRRRVFDEQFLVYTALTRAGEQLWVSYPLTDTEGRTIAPSQIIFIIKELIPQMEERVCLLEPVREAGAIGVGTIADGTKSDGAIAEAAIADGTIVDGAIANGGVGAIEVRGIGDREFIVQPNLTLAYLISRLRELKAGRNIHPVWLAVYNWFMLDDERKEYAHKLLGGLFCLNRENNLSLANSRSIYGHTLRSGVSRLEKFRSCPFAHFAYYGLGLRERAMFKLAAPDMGEFFHAALKGFAQRLQEECLDWGQLSREECLRICGEVVDGLVPQLQSEILLSTKRLRYLTRKLKQIVQRAVLVLAEHARRSKFRPVGLELAFGGEEGLPPVRLKLADGTNLELTGRIDRVDMAVSSAEKIYLRVIDYKSGETKISLPEIYHGLRLQLLTYLHVVLTYSKLLTGREGLPGGIFYFLVKDPTISHQGPLDRELVEQAVLKKLKMRGLLLAEKEVLQLMDNQVENGTSHLIPAGLKKDGSFRSDSQVVTAQQFSLLRKHLEGLLTQTGQAILAGEINIVPYRDKLVTACSYCAYKPVCRFDLQLGENRFRSIAKLSVEQIWETLRAEEVAK